ncbi:putative transporter [Flavobacterium psychrotolerans]|uniref:Putative transporter n=1 Tax=Flavobacterium psychrotolerans TaxID=2169410 RepID=A0A2U1JG56_9FLAO|nr:putative transporter [Flavobacterium psychrotolerans]PWA03918.1 putative transporter [Flavobacterium psychrotolerans]
MFEWFKILFTPTEEPEMTQALIVLFLAISVGFFVGRIKIGSVSLGVSAVMFVGLFLGHLGFSMNAELIQFVREFGLILFVYGIGIQVGPSFFSSFKKEGLIFNALGVGTVFLGGIITYLIHLLANVKIENAVGLMSGSVTNTPGLGAAKSTLIEIQKQLNLPLDHFSDPTVAYAITYPIGVFGIILIIILAKNFLKIDLSKEAVLLNEKNKDSENKIVHQKCRVTKPEVIGKTIKQVFKEFHIDNVIISRQKQSGTRVVYSPSLESIIKEKDVLMVVAKQKDIDTFIDIVGKVSTDLLIESQDDVTTKILSVTKKTATHKTLAQLDLYNQYDVKVTRVIRSGLEILAQPSLELYYGDTLMVVGEKHAIHEAEKIIGNSKKILLEPDFLSLFGGLIFGVIIGSIPIMIPSLPVPLKLGLAAGPLMAALFISRYGGVGVIHSYINNGAIHFMKDFGICLFFAAVGIKAGHGFYDNFIGNNGWMWIYYGCYITLIPLTLLVLISRFVFKLNFYQMVGIMSGSYTDPAALAFSTKYLDSDIPNQSYATVYPLVTISRILVAQLLILLFAS